MSGFIRFVGSVVIALILMCIPGLLVASFAFEWHSFLKALLFIAAVAECALVMSLVYDRSEE